MCVCKTHKACSMFGAVCLVVRKMQHSFELVIVCAEHIWSQPHNAHIHTCRYTQVCEHKNIGLKQPFPSCNVLVSRNTEPSKSTHIRKPLLFPLQPPALCPLCNFQGQPVETQSSIRRVMLADVFYDGQGSSTVSTRVEEFALGLYFSLSPALVSFAVTSSIALFPLVLPLADTCI